MAAAPFAPLMMPDGLSNVTIGSPPAVHVTFAQIRKVIVPVSGASGSVNVAVSVGVAVVLYEPFAGPTREGTSGVESVIGMNDQIELKPETALPLSVLLARQ